MANVLEKFMSLKDFFKSRYVTSLEEEVIRLRAELRLWQDAALVKEGLPRLTKNEIRPLPHIASKPLPSQWRRKMESLVAEIQERKDEAKPA